MRALRVDSSAAPVSSGARPHSSTADSHASAARAAAPAAAGFSAASGLSAFYGSIGATVNGSAGAAVGQSSVGGGWPGSVVGARISSAAAAGNRRSSAGAHTAAPTSGVGGASRYTFAAPLASPANSAAAATVATRRPPSASSALHRAAAHPSSGSSFVRTRVDRGATVAALYAAAMAGQDATADDLGSMQSASQFGAHSPAPDSPWTATSAYSASSLPLRRPLVSPAAAAAVAARSSFAPSASVSAQPSLHQQAVRSRVQEGTQLSALGFAAPIHSASGFSSSATLSSLVPSRSSPSPPPSLSPSPSPSPSDDADAGSDDGEPDRSPTVVSPLRPRSAIGLSRSASQSREEGKGWAARSSEPVITGSAGSRAVAHGSLQLSSSPRISLTRRDDGAAQELFAASTSSVAAAPSRSAPSRSTSSSSHPSSSVCIRVIDPVSAERYDHLLPRALVVESMPYFASFLSASAASASSSSASRAKPVTIEVACDLRVFDWLVQWVRSRAGARDDAPPLLSVDNVPSLLLSSAFLRMAPLTADCVDFVGRNLELFLALDRSGGAGAVDLAALSDEQIDAIAQARFIDAEDFFDDETSDFAPADPTWLPRIPRGLAALQALSASDRSDRIASRLWRAKLQAMLRARMQRAQEHGQSMQCCAHCKSVYWEGDGASDLAVNALCPSPLSPRSVGLHGELLASHAPTAGWSASGWILSLRLRGAGWAEGWCALYGLCHASPRESACVRCGITGGFLWAHAGHCRSHALPPVVRGSTLVYPCCNRPTQPFAEDAGSGCRTGLHKITLSPSASRLQRTVFEVVRTNIDAITRWHAVDESVFAAGIEGPPPAPHRKQVSISLAERVAGPEASPFPLPTAAAPSEFAVVGSKRRAATHATTTTATMLRPASSRRSVSSERSDSDASGGSDRSSGSAGRWGDGSGSDDDVDSDASRDRSDDSDSDGGGRSWRAQRESRLAFRPGYEGANPHGHARAKDRAAPPSASLQLKSTQGPIISRPQQRAPSGLAEDALRQLQAVMSPAEFDDLAARMDAEPQRGTQSATPSASPTSAMSRALAVRGVDRSQSQSSSAPTLKSILKASTAVVIPSAAHTSSASKLSEVSAVWGEVVRPQPHAGLGSSGSSASLFNADADAPPPRKKLSSFRIDDLLEEDRQRMSALVAKLAQNSVGASDVASVHANGRSAAQGRAERRATSRR